MGLPGTEHRPENDLANKPTCENSNFNHLSQGYWAQLIQTPSFTCTMYVAHFSTLAEALVIHRDLSQSASGALTSAIAVNAIAEQPWKQAIHDFREATR